MLAHSSREEHFVESTFDLSSLRTWARDSLAASRSELADERVRSLDPSILTLQTQHADEVDDERVLRLAVRSSARRD
jgi:hypothetical protein